MGAVRSDSGDCFVSIIEAVQLLQEQLFELRGHLCGLIDA